MTCARFDSQDLAGRPYCSERYLARSALAPRGASFRSTDLIHLSKQGVARFILDSLARRPILAPASGCPKLPIAPTHLSTITSHTPPHVPVSDNSTRQIYGCEIRFQASPFVGRSTVFSEGKSPTGSPALGSHLNRGYFLRATADAIVARRALTP